MTAKEKIINAFFDLLNIKSFDDITISELCLVSKVHRTTFYLYFDNLYELLIESIEISNSKFFNYFPKQNKNEKHMNKDYLVPYLKFIKDNKNIFLAYINNKKLLKAPSHFNTIFTEISIPNSQEQDPRLIKYITLFYIGGIIFIVKEWIHNDFLESPEELADIILATLRSTPNALTD